MAVAPAVLAGAFGYVWAAPMFALASHGDLRLWAGFLAVAPLTLKAALIVLQYATTRALVRRRVLAAGASR